MNEQTLFTAIGGADDAYLLELEQPKLRRLPRHFGLIAAMLTLLLTACAAPVGLLALPTLNKRKALAESLLRRLGMPDHLLGFRSTALGAAWLSAAPYPHPPARHWLYPLLAEECSVSPAAIERRIRSAIEYTWLYGDLSTQSMLFGFTVSAERGKPTNAEFLSLLSEHIRRQLLLPAQ